MPLSQHLLPKLSARDPANTEDSDILNVIRSPPSMMILNFGIKFFTCLEGCYQSSHLSSTSQPLASLSGISYSISIRGIQSHSGPAKPTSYDSFKILWYALLGRYMVFESVSLCFSLQLMSHRINKLIVSKCFFISVFWIPFFFLLTCWMACVCHLFGGGFFLWSSILFLMC